MYVEKVCEVWEEHTHTQKNGVLRAAARTKSTEIILIIIISIMINRMNVVCMAHKCMNVNE